MGARRQYQQNYILWQPHEAIALTKGCRRDKQWQMVTKSWHTENIFLLSLHVETYVELLGVLYEWYVSDVPEFCNLSYIQLRSTQWRLRSEQCFTVDHKNTLEMKGRIEKTTIMRHKLTAISRVSVACRGKFFASLVVFVLICYRLWPIVFMQICSDMCYA